MHALSRSGDVTQLIVHTHPCIVLLKALRMPLVAEGDDSTVDAVGISLALENTHSDGADEAVIAKYFLASLAIHGM